MNPRPYSLRLHLLALISVPVILAGSAIGGLALYFAYHEIDEIYDVQLVHAAHLLHDLAEHGLADDDRLNVAPHPHDETLSHYYEQKLLFRVWKDEILIAESASASILGSAMAPPGFSLQQIDGEDWHFFVHVDERSEIVVEVAEHAVVRTELILQLLGSVLAPALLFVPLILALVWLGVTRSLWPMVALARELNQRYAADLTPLAMERVPGEIAPFINALNRLFGRVERAMRIEREFTDNAAHELRTPLAAMKTQAQVLKKQAGLRRDDREGVDNLIESIDRSTRMVEQLLAFSRLQHMDMPFAPVDIGELVSDAVRELAPQAMREHRDIRADITPGIEVTGAAAALAVLIRNLIDNALKYSPAGTTIGVTVTREQGWPAFIVSDSGPGIPMELQERVFDRFYRIPRADDDDNGSGLGLAMVRWIADMHKAEVTLENLQPRGLRAKVLFKTRRHPP